MTEAPGPLNQRHTSGVGEAQWALVEPLLLPLRSGNVHVSVAAMHDSPAAEVLLSDTCQRQQEDLPRLEGVVVASVWRASGQGWRPTS